MSIFSRLFSGKAQNMNAQASSGMPPESGILIQTSAELEEVLRSGLVSSSGARVTTETAMRVAAVFACVRIISGAVANLPLHIKRRVDNRNREDASDSDIWHLLRRKPNRWQTPSQFKRLMQINLLLRGNAYAYISRSRGIIREIIPLDPDRVICKQNDDLSLTYRYSTKNGKITEFTQHEIMHIVGLSLNGYTGVSVIRYARETIGLSLSMENHGASTFKNGARMSGVLYSPNKLGKEAQSNLKSSLDTFRTGGENENKALILEEGMKYEPISMTAEDAQWIEARQFSRTDIAMFFGVPPHMLGDTQKTTSWGSGIEQQSTGFVTYTLEDHLTAWEETINRDLIAESDIYARFNRAALVKGDIKTRWEAYVKGMQWGVYSPNEVRALEDMNPRPDGDIYYPPPNMSGTEPLERESDEPAQTA